MDIICTDVKGLRIRLERIRWAMIIEYRSCVRYSYKAYKQCCQWQTNVM